MMAETQNCTVPELTEEEDQADYTGKRYLHKNATLQPY